MINFKQHFSFFNRIFNINEGEWSRVALIWLLKFLYRFGFVIGWTLITAMFVARFGIELLPYLFVANAIFIMSGSVAYVSLLRKFKRSSLIISTIFLAGLLLFGVVLLPSSENLLLFLFLLLTESLFLVQLNILFEDLIESFFSSLESERAFPVIESADTFGGITAGITILALADVIPSFKFVHIWLVALFLLVPLVLKFRSFKLEFALPKKNKNRPIAPLFKRISLAVQYVSQMKFLRALTLIIFFHWIFLNLMEFQYTRAVYEHVRLVLPAEGSGFENALVHDLGSLNVLFYGSALVVQLFLGSRLLTTLGIVGSMLLYPIIMLLSIVGLFINYNFFTAVLAKNNHVISGVLFKNSYLSSYYAIKENVRSYMREFLEGFVHPFGAIVGTAILILFQALISGEGLTLSLSLFMFGILSLMLYLFLRMQKYYTEMASYDLLHSTSDGERMNSIEVLAQKGHHNAVPVFVSVLSSEKVSTNVKLRILSILRGDIPKEIITDLLQLLPNSSEKLQYAALEVIESFEDWHILQSNHVFSQHRILNVLQDEFKKSNSVPVQILIMRILAKMNHFDAVSFLLAILKTRKEPGLLAACISVCRLCNDVHFLHYVKPFLKHKDDHVRAQAIVSLLKFPEQRFADAETLALEMLDCGSSKKKIAILKAISDLGPNLNSFRKPLSKLLKDKNSTVTLFAALALARIGDNACLKTLMHFLFDGSVSDVKMIKSDFHLLDPSIKSTLSKFIHREASLRLRNYIKSKSSSKIKIKKRSVSELRTLLGFIESETEMTNIESLLEENKKKQYAY